MLIGSAYGPEMVIIPANPEEIADGFLQDNRGPHAIRHFQPAHGLEVTTWGTPTDAEAWSKCLRE
jgi:hypothetical protein